MPVLEPALASVNAIILQRKLLDIFKTLSLSLNPGGMFGHICTTSLSHPLNQSKRN